MPSWGEQQVVAGTALVLAAAPAGRMRLVDAAAVLGPMSAVPAGVLTGTASGSVTQLVSPTDPQAVLAQLRTVAHTEGPLTLFLTGQLHLDKREGLPHLALADTQPATVRYSGLPWSWLAHELRLRRAPTAVFVDLYADGPAWEHVRARSLGLGPAVALFGAVSPAQSRRRPAPPAYAQALAVLLRGQVARPPLHELHQVVLERAGLAPEALVFTPAEPPPADPRPPAVRPAPAANAPARPAAPVPAPSRPVDPVPSVDPVRHVEPLRPVDPAPAVARHVEPGPVHAVDPGPPAATAVVDPHPAILEAARAGRHGEAASAAAAWEQYALRTHGAGSREAVHWVEVRADLARLAGEPARSCELWLMAASARLAAGQAAGDPDVEGAVDRGHHQWEQIRDRPRARELFAALSALREQVPGRQPGAREALRQRGEALEGR
jgi:hypothetical protein